jgi:hypothetical protein
MPGMVRFYLIAGLPFGVLAGSRIQQKSDRNSNSMVKCFGLGGQ